MKLRLSKCYPVGPLPTLEHALFLLIELESPTVNFVIKADSLSSTGHKINLAR